MSCTEILDKVAYLTSVTGLKDKTRLVACNGDYEASSLGVEVPREYQHVCVGMISLYTG